MCGIARRFRSNHGLFDPLPSPISHIPKQAKEHSHVRSQSQGALSSPFCEAIVFFHPPAPVSPIETETIAWSICDCTRLRPNSTGRWTVLSESAFIRGNHVSTFESNLNQTLNPQPCVAAEQNGCPLLALRASMVRRRHCPRLFFHLNCWAVAEVGALPSLRTSTPPPSSSTPPLPNARERRARRR